MKTPARRVRAGRCGSGTSLRRCGRASQRRRHRRAAGPLPCCPGRGWPSLRGGPTATAVHRHCNPDGKGGNARAAPGGRTKAARVAGSAYSTRFFGRFPTRPSRWREQLHLLQATRVPHVRRTKDRTTFPVQCAAATPASRGGRCTAACTTACSPAVRAGGATRLVKRHGLGTLLTNGAHPGANRLRVPLQHRRHAARGPFTARSNHRACHRSRHGRVPPAIHSLR